MSDEGGGDDDIEITARVCVFSVDGHSRRFKLAEPVTLCGVVRLLSPGDIVNTEPMDSGDHLLLEVLERAES